MIKVKAILNKNELVIEIKLTGSISNKVLIYGFDDSKTGDVEVQRGYGRIVRIWIENHDINASIKCFDENGFDGAKVGDFGSCIE